MLVSVVTAAVPASGIDLWPFNNGTQSSGGQLGGAPSMRGVSSQSTPGWSASRAWSGVKSGTKKALSTTVDVVTLKPLRTPKPKAPNSHLGLHRDPRTVEHKPGILSSLFRKTETEEPSTVEEFFSQERP